ncbi:MAG: hypothetical protein AAF909_14295, partial [Pseudomonadota bacterium]
MSKTYRPTTSRRDDIITAEAFERFLKTRGGDDQVTLLNGAGLVSLGSGEDTLQAAGHVRRVDAGGGD